MTYLFDDIANFTDENYFTMLNAVSGGRAEKSLRYRYMADKKTSLIAYLLLLYGLRNEFGADTQPEFSVGKFGKPYIPGSRISFNMSHTRKGVMCSIFQNRVGCDIESEIRKPVEAPSVFCRNEISLIRRQERLFTKLWTLKEAYAKCMGFGLTENLTVIDFTEFVLKEKFETNGKQFLSRHRGDLYYSVCIDGRQEDIQNVRFLKSEELLEMKGRI